MRRELEEVEDPMHEEECVSNCDLDFFNCKKVYYCTFYCVEPAMR